MSRKTIRIELTQKEAIALAQIISYADHDGDCVQWHKDAGATAAEIRAMQSVERKVIHAACVAKQGDSP